MSFSLQTIKSLSIDAISPRLKMLSNYLTSFPLPDNKSFSQKEMIEIVLSILPAVWVNSTIQGENIQRPDWAPGEDWNLSTRWANSREERQQGCCRVYEYYKDSKENKPDKKPKVQFGEGAVKGERQQKSYELCKIIKGVDNPAWKNHNTKDYRSKTYYKKRVASTTPDEPPLKKENPTVVLVM